MWAIVSNTDLGTLRNCFTPISALHSACFHSLFTGSVLDPLSLLTKKHTSQLQQAVMTSLMIAGLGIAGAAFAARLITRSFRQIQKQAASLPKSPIFHSYYKGGFEPKISRREAGLILGISPSSPKDRVKEAHKRIMLLNHPDRGGSPYLAAKINEAKDYLETDGKSAR